MKKILCLLLAVMLIASLGGCADTFLKDAKLPPARTGAANMYASLAKEYTFETAFEEADAVARIQVGSWLGEDTNLKATYFQARVLECFKGNMPDTFTLRQDGCTTHTYTGYPLFTAGNELLVFLNEGSITTYDSPYWIIGTYTTFMDVLYDNAGNRYYGDRKGHLGQTVEIGKNYTFDYELFQQMYENLKETDSLFAEREYQFPYIYAEADLKAYLK